MNACQLVLEECPGPLQGSVSSKQQVSGRLEQIGEPFPQRKLGVRWWLQLSKSEWRYLCLPWWRKSNGRLCIKQNTDKIDTAVLRVGGWNQVHCEILCGRERQHAGEPLWRREGVVIRQHQALGGSGVDRGNSQPTHGALAQAHLPTKNAKPPGAQRVAVIRVSPPGAGHTRSHFTPSYSLLFLRGLSALLGKLCSFMLSLSTGEEFPLRFRV